MATNDNQVRESARNSRENGVQTREPAADDTKYQLRRVDPRCWSIVDAESGRPVAYPGVDLATAARSWLRWETGADDPTAADLVEFAERVAAAERRILAALQAHDRD